jgi:hypothetical protein
MERERERESEELAGLTGKRGFHALLKVLDDKPLASREKTRRMGPTDSSPYFSARLLGTLSLR